MANINELNLNNTQDFNEYVEKSLVATVKEILKHFSTRYRKSNDDDDDDSRYLYNARELEMFNKMNDNPNLKIEPLYENGRVTPWCYRIYRKA